MARKWFLPSPAGALLLLLGLGLQAVPWGGVSTLVPAGGGSTAIQTRMSCGLPPSVHLTWGDAGDGTPETMAVEVDWHLALPTLLVLYLASAAVGRAVTPPGRPWRPLRVLLAVAGCVGLLAFAAGVGSSRYHWGYFISRPAPDARIAGATRILSVTSVRTVTRPDGSIRFIADDEAREWVDFEARLRDPDRDPYYMRDMRVPYVLHDRGVPLAGLPETAEPQLATLYDRLSATGRVDAASKELAGVVLEALGPGGEPLLFVGVTDDRGGDRHACMEFLFDNRPAASAPSEQALSVKKYYYDIAGMEWVEWWTVTLALSVVGLVLTLPVALLAMAVLRMREHRRIEAPGFPVGPA